jgi:hypothetical protein
LVIDIFEAIRGVRLSKELLFVLDPSVFAAKFLDLFSSLDRLLVEVLNLIML